MKQCSKCGLSKSLNEFANRKDFKDGLRGSCKTCMYDMRRQWRKDNAVDLKKKKKQHYQNNREKILAKWKKHHEENRDHCLSIQRKTVKKLKTENPIKFRSKEMIHYIRRHAKEKNLPYDKNIDWLYLFNILKKEKCCPICGQVYEYYNGNRRTSPSIDRIIPLKGYTLDNLHIICDRCNNLKCDGIIQDFINIINYMKLPLDKKIVQVSNFKKIVSPIHKHPLHLKSNNVRIGMRNRSRDRNLLFDRDYFTTELLINYFVNNKQCICCHQNFYFGPGYHPCTPSSDRINPYLYYTKDNVAIICYRCNSIKRDGSINEVQNILNYIQTISIK